jgi:hypothetical protein
MSHFAWKILTLTLLLAACKDGAHSEDQNIITEKAVSLREEPSEKGREIVFIQPGEVLLDLGETSSHESQIMVGKQVYQTPWIRVETPDKQSGWVLAWALRPVRKQVDWLLQKRIECYFGKVLAAKRNSLWQTIEKAETASKLSETWRASAAFRDTTLLLLAQRSEGNISLEYDWLNELLPGFIFQKSETGDRSLLFAAFEFWHQKALKTNGLEDDVFFETCFLAYPKDHIESFFPAWKFQLSETESASQLGTGVHLKMLQQIDQVLETGRLFVPELETLKDQLLEDIFDKGVQYWQSKEKILAELDQIIANPPQCLNPQELESLGIRQNMFRDPVSNGIVVNLRSGG